VKRKHLWVCCLLIFSLLCFTACGANGDGASNETKEEAKQEVKVPDLKLSYIFTNHQTPLMVAVEKGETFKDSGVYLKEVVNRQKYILMKEENPVANIELVVCKSGSETMTMMAQGHIDIAFASSAANISAIDKGTKVKMLCPVHTEGIGLVVKKDAAVNNWEEFLTLIKEKKEPVKVGYHSPTSAPVILFEAALKKAGISYTFDPEDLEKDILLVNVKGTTNLLPVLVSDQVDAWVGPSPYPELAETENVGKIILDMKHLPPEGEWYDFPCCVASATDKTIEENPVVLEDLMKLMRVAADYANEHKDEAAKITADFTGVSEEAAQKSSIKYTADPSETWVSNLGLVYDTLKKANKFSGSFVEKEYKDVQNDLFDFSFIKKALDE
jgi:NitT/TauT family transport system substrate-binding protein